MRRGFGIILSCLLLLLTVATAAVWVIDVDFKPLGWESDFDRNFAVHVLCHHNTLSVDFFIVNRPYQETTLDGWGFEGGGFEIAYFGTHLPPGSIPRRPPRYRFAAPFWFYLLLFSTFPLVTFARWILRRRHPPTGHCPCGYDLTGNVTGQCPECGIEI